MAKERDQTPLPPQPQQQLRTLQDYFRPVVNGNYLRILQQTINANNFELKPALINMVKQSQYGGLSHKDPNIHLAMFLEDLNLKVSSTWVSRLVSNSTLLQCIEWANPTIVDATAGGTLLSKMAEKAYALFEEMACNNYQWLSKRSIGRQVAGVHEVDQMAARFSSSCYIIKPN
ncbi:putative Transposable element protein [Melia azedarach]|uniref:Transposable element protein n=1 Tax=Melia azedarach TaxID=155640 RepID=A0ACC1YP83_MELAZ|nr:putative Transposable element protein [Melia azedarach]